METDFMARAFLGIRLWERMREPHRILARMVWVARESGGFRHGPTNPQKVLVLVNPQA